MYPTTRGNLFRPKNHVNVNVLYVQYALKDTTLPCCPPVPLEKAALHIYAPSERSGNVMTLSSVIITF